MARRQSSRALSPAPEGYSHTRSLLPYQWPFFGKLSGSGLAFEFPQSGASPLGGSGSGETVQDRKRRGPPFPLQAVRFLSRKIGRHKEPGCLRSGLSAQGAGNVWAPSKEVEGQDRCSLRKPSMTCQRLGPERHCPLSVHVPSVVQYSKQRKGRPTQALKRTAEAF